MTDDEQARIAAIQARWDGFDWSSHGNAVKGQQAIKDIHALLTRIESDRAALRGLVTQLVDEANAIPVSENQNVEAIRSGQASAMIACAGRIQALLAGVPEVAAPESQDSELDRLVAEYKHIADNDGTHLTKDLIWLLNELIYEREHSEGASHATSR